MADTSSARQLGGPGFAVVERVRDAIERHRMLSEGEKVIVGVSGGPDSVCLLDTLQRLSGSLDLTLVVAHVDHGLSEESAGIAARVSTRSAEAGLDVHVMRIADLEGPNLHERARTLRYGFFENVAARVGATKMATGHTLDDRVETTLARLIHGAGTSGLAGLVPVEGKRIRPLIDCRRKETRAYAEECDLEFVDDPANEDHRFDRSSVRHLVLGPIEERWGDGAVRAMAVSAERLAEDASALTKLASRIYEGLAKSDDGAVRFARDGFLVLPRAVRRRLLEQAVGRVRDRSGGIDAALDALEREPKPGARFALVSEIEIIIERDAVVVVKPSSPEVEA